MVTAMIENLSSVALFLLNECVLIEEERQKKMPVWVSAQGWHELIAERLKIELPIILQAGKDLIVSGLIEVHESGRAIRPAGGHCHG